MLSFFHVVMAGVVALTGTSPLGTAAPSAPPALSSYVRTAYDGVIYELNVGGSRALTWTDWESLGFPAFSDAETDYFKVLDLPTVYAYTYFESTDEEVLMSIDFNQWTSAGWPVPARLAWADWIIAYKWPTSPEIFATDFSGSVQKLTFSQWRDAAFPTFESRDNRGFVAMSWDKSGAIAYLCDARSGKGGRISYADWLAWGSPTPQVVTRTTNDHIVQWDVDLRRATGEIDYIGPASISYTRAVPFTPSPTDMFGRHLSFTEWSAMGSPAPARTAAFSPLVNDIYCGSADPSPTDR
ncbi:hypothetical protein MXD81_29025 [Microbacteriaceae bacterium K1510]|nr:hypothetical protein [Microbacteriaceae bacterium K1510]